MSKSPFPCSVGTGVRRDDKEPFDPSESPTTCFESFLLGGDLINPGDGSSIRLCRCRLAISFPTVVPRCSISDFIRLAVAMAL
jgi:hypothetical protein